MNTNLNTSWLPLNEYSQKYRVSISTLRRRIKKNLVEFKYSNGKYILPDKNLPEPVSAILPKESVAETQTKKEEGSVLIAAHQLLKELKEAYMSSLKERDCELVKLKEKNVNLQTLVGVLESKLDQLEKKTEEEDSFIKTHVSSNRELEDILGVGKTASPESSQEIFSSRTPWVD